MGVPTFYKWLSTRYPLVIKNAVEESSPAEDDCESNEEGEEGSSNYPNGKFDNLYLDMNGIVHPCTHPETGMPPRTEDEMFLSIFEYIDRIFNIVKPRKLLYLALDGVAPRAKMNQQRTRRFKSAKLVDIEKNCYETLKERYLAEGKKVPPLIEKWDSNVITPGTIFMRKLSDSLKYYICHRQSTNKYWRDIKVLFSDSSSPGEGEHKIMLFIRNQRNCESYDPNTSHVIHGADADLIMLGLASHEVHFSILREMVAERKLFCHICKKEGHTRETCTVFGEAVEDNIRRKSSVSQRSNWKELQFLQLSVLRDYLAMEIPEEIARRAKVKFSLERYIDDFVLLCFFCGNDFLPHIPSLSIHKGSVDILMEMYKTRFPTINDYLTNEGKINLDEMKSFVKDLGDLEKVIFIEEINQQERQKQREAQRMNAEMAQAEAEQVLREHEKKSPPLENKVEDDTKRALREVEKFYEELKKLVETENQIKDTIDTIRLGEGNVFDWRRKYYWEKFHLNRDDDLEAFSQKVASMYIEGLLWVLEYYYQGCASWEWYYPFHYAPLAMDLSKANIKGSFRLGAPFYPLEQLMAVLPPASSHCLPSCLAVLMVSEDSPILDFYPSNFVEDPDGKRMRWQWVALLPFVDTKRLRLAVAEVQNQLHKEEMDRNVFSEDLLYVSAQSDAYDQVRNFHNVKSHSGKILLKANNLMGYVSSAPLSSFVYPGQSQRSSIATADTVVSNSLCCTFENIPSHHKSVLLENTVFPDATIGISPPKEAEFRRGFNAGAVRRIIMFYTRTKSTPSFKKYSGKDQQTPEAEIHENVHPPHNTQFSNNLDFNPSRSNMFAKYKDSRNYGNIIYNEEIPVNPNLQKDYFKAPRHPHSYNSRPSGYYQYQARRQT